MVYVGRFAPSPTGPLHYGSLVTALASYLDARHHQGRWLLRIEDLDPPRESEAAPDIIMRQLEAFGMHWDGPVLFQSTRLEAYEAALQSLDNQTFECICTRKSTPPIYPGTCRDRTHPENTPFSVRYEIADEHMTIHDRLQGKLSWSLPEDVGDFIIKRKDGLFAYQLAVVVDDIAQSVTDIVRGLDLLDSTPRQLALYQGLAEPAPNYLHLPLLVDRQGNKLSKQAHATAVPISDLMKTIRLALKDLGQQPLEDADNMEDLLREAAANWQVKDIPRTPQRLAPARFLQQSTQT